MMSSFNITKERNEVKIIKELNKNADVKGLNETIEFSKEIGSKYLDSSKLFEYMLCIDEVFTNCIIHAYRNMGGAVKVKYLLRDEYLITKISDNGIGMCDNYEISPSTLDTDILASSGRGLYIVSNLCSKLTIEKKNDLGTEVSIYFERSCDL